jgi:hypothetical protein
VCGVAPLASGEMRSVQCLAVAVYALLSGALRCISTHKGVTDTPRASTVCVSPEVLLCSEVPRSRGASGGMEVWGGSPCTAVPHTVPVLTRGCRAGCESRWGKLRGQLSTHAPSEQTHPQNSRSLQGVPPSCCGRRAAVWVFEPAVKRKRHDVQACEPGRRGCGEVPVHPARLPTHRTSPDQALLTTLIARHAEPHV